MSNQFNTKFFSQLLNHSCKTKNLPAVKSIHAHLITTNLLFTSLHFHNNIILAYTTCLNINSSKILTHCLKFFDTNNPLPFNLLLSHFRRNGFPSYALKTFSLMHIYSVPLDTYALCTSLIASSSVKDLNFGEQIHAHVVKSGWLASIYVGSALIDLYSKLSFLSDAAMVFDEIPLKNTVCANALLSGYIEAKSWDQGVQLIQKMPLLNLHYDNLSVLAMLKISAGLCSIGLGRQVHAYLTRKNHSLQSDIFLQSALIEMYGKSGYVEKALQVFNFAGDKDIVLWTSMLGVYSRSGCFNQVISFFNDMLQEGTKPDRVAFVTVISACARTGQVELGIEYLESMSRDFGINPGAEHYSCVVELLCKAGELEKAWKLAMERPCISMWGALLSACEEQENVELGKLAAEEALKLEPQNVGIYVVLSNLYAGFGMWDEIGHLRELMKDRGLKKDVGCSWIEVTSETWNITCKVATNRSKLYA